MNAEAEDANSHVAGVVGKVEVDQDLMPTLCERTTVTHHAHIQQDTVQYLELHRTPLASRQVYYLSTA